MVKELSARADHDALWNGIDLGLHLKVIVALQVDQQDSEVGAAQVEGQEFAFLCNQG